MNMMTAARKDAAFRVKPYENGVTVILLTRASSQEGRFNRDDTGRRNAVTIFEKFDYKKRPPMVSVSLCRVLRHLQRVDEKRRG